MFGVMFGDVGHGLGLVVLSFLLFFRPRWFPKSALNVRYLFVMLGLFSVFCGLVYNEFFAVPLPLADSCYNDKSLTRKSDCVYPLGMDFRWELSDNSITFINSFKMKISVVYGVLHMILGILLKGLNDLQDGSQLRFLTEFLP